jgi:myo-inositol 2-dehydrogenase/D-chiro-inositol 1-dehydrogenase
MKKAINVGLIGAGRIGRVHATTLAHHIPEVRLLAIADVIPEAAQACAIGFQIPKCSENHLEILEDPEIDAVVICSSTDTHARFIEESAIAGKHIFCEKPIDHDLERIDRALEAVEKAGVKLQIGFNRRFDPSFKQVHDMVLEGKVGRPHIVRITSRDPEPPPIDYVKVSGGIFLDMTIHDFDMARYLIDSEIEEVYAAGGVMVDSRIGEAGDIDTAVILLRYANGAIGVIDNSRRAVYGYDQRIEVFGSEGGAVVSNLTPNQAVLSDTKGVHASKPLYFFMQRYTDSYIAEMKEFIKCIKEDKKPSVTGVDGRIPVVMGLAAWKSYRENRPVRLTEIG